jgi:hypothetical protein
MILLAFVFSSSVLFSQIALRGTATTAINTAASVTINRPTGVVAGDLLIANVSNYCDCGQVSASSSGWTLIAGTDIHRGRASLLYKIAGGSEPSTYAFAVTSGSGASTGAIVAFSGVNNTTPFDNFALASLPLSWTIANSQTMSSISSVTTATNNSA